MSGWRFWVVTGATAVGIAVTGALGGWQLGRANEKESLASSLKGQQELPPLTQEQFLAADRRVVLYRSVRLRGKWEPSQSVFLDNRQMGGKVGFYVATPLRLAGIDRVVLVQRGWVPRNFVNREALPPVDTPGGEVEITGRIAPPPAKLYQFGSAGSGPIRQNLDLAPFAAETRLPLITDVTVQQTGAASEGLLRQWPEGAHGGRGPETNYGYAFQWWALSALIAVLYAWFQILQPRRRRRPL